jgi:hypothetical protein
MQSPDWLSSGYVVGPITSSNPGRGGDTAEMTVNGDEADDQLVLMTLGTMIMAVATSINATRMRLRTSFKAA